MTLTELSALIPQLFAPWVQDLNLSPVELNESSPQANSETASCFLLPVSEHIIRSGGKGGGVVCGQALAAAADTVSVLSLTHQNNRFRACTTTDINIRFMRALSAEHAVLMSVSMLSNGRRMAVTSVDMQSESNPKIAASATCSFMYLED